MVMNEITMENGHDYVALSWVKSEILVNLNQVQQLLEQLSKDPRELGELFTCYELLHQVNGALFMLGYPGASLFTKEMERLCNALAKNKIANITEGLQILVQAALQLPAYIEIIQTEGHDIPIALLPIINEMRLTCKLAPLTEIELFSNQIDSSGSPLTNEELDEIGKEGLVNLLRKLRQSLQLSLINIIQGKDIEQALSHLFKVFNYLNRLCKTTPIANLWAICIAFIEGLTDKSIAYTPEVKELLKQLDKPLKTLIDQGITGMNTPAQDALIQNLLFQIANTKTAAPHILAIKQEYQLNQSISDITTVKTSTAQATLGKLDSTTLNSIANALGEEFTQIKEFLDLFARNRHHTAADLNKLPDTFKQISNILEMLGFNQQQQLVNKQLQVLENMISIGQVDTDRLMDIASSILDIETVVTNIRQGLKSIKKQPTITTGIINNAQLAVIKEASNELTKIKDIISIVVSSGGYEGNIQEVCDLFEQVAKSLVFISLNKAAAIILRCLQYINKKITSDNNLPMGLEADALVCVIASLDYYLECLIKDQDISCKDALNFAVKYLTELDYPLPDDYDTLINQYIKDDHSALDIETIKPSDETSEVTVDTFTETKQSTVNEYNITVPENIAAEIDPEFAEILIEEMEEILADLAIKLPRWLMNLEDTATLADIRRAFHTIKGSGRTVKAIIIGELGWAIENMLNRVIDNTIKPTDQVLQVIQDVVKLLPELVQDFANNQQHQRDDVDHLASIAHSLSQPKKANTQTNTQKTINTDIKSVEIAQKAEEALISATKMDESLAFELERSTKETSEKILTNIEEQDNQLLEIETLKSITELDSAESIDINTESLAFELEHSTKETSEKILTNIEEQDNQLLEIETLEPIAELDSVESTDINIAPLVFELEHSSEETNEKIVTDTKEQATQSQEIEALVPETEQSFEQSNEHVTEDFDRELLDIFVAESKNHLKTLQEFIESYKTDAPQKVNNALQRAMHTLKGSALMAGIEPIAILAKPFEGFLKECNINDWLLEQTDITLLKSAFTLLDKGIQQLELYSLEPIEGTAELVQQITERRHAILAQIETSIKATPLGVNNDISNLGHVSNQILQSMDFLLDAEDYITQWHSTPNNMPKEIDEIYAELETIFSIAHQAGMMPVSELCNALIHCYNQIKANALIINEAFFDTLIDAHSALLNMADQLAAALSIEHHQDEIQQLNALKTIAINQKPTQSQSVTTQETNKKVSSASLKINITSYPNDKIDPDMVDIFLEEADEILIAAKEELNNWITTKDLKALQALQRQLHTLKGGARMCGILSIGDLAHGLEFIYEGLINDQYTYSNELVTLLNKTHDTIQNMVDNLHDHQPVIFDLSLLDSIRIFKDEKRVVFATEQTQPTIETSFNESPQLKPETTSEQPSKLITQEAKPIIEPKHLFSIDDLVAELTYKTEKTVVDSGPEDIGASITPEPSVIEKENTAITLEPAQETDSKPLVIEQPMLQQKETLATKQLAKDDTIVEPIKQAQQPITVTHKEPKEQVKVSADLLDSLINLAGETSIYRSRVEQQVNDLTSALFEINTTIDRVNDQLRRLDIETQSQIISKHKSETHRSSSYMDFDPLEMDQYSQIQQLSRSLFESASDLHDIKETLIHRSRDMETLLQQQARVNTELQEGLMRTRMVPLERIVPRLRRLVRQISSELGKKIELSVGNAFGEMDRGVIDSIVTPLEHMIRNAADHGIESIEERIAKGKPEAGHIYIDLNREGGEMVLTLKDDGAGINIANVRTKAINKGIMGAEETLTDQEVLQFILEPGFSTAEIVTQISGRGVGLDVVVNAVKQLGGVLSLDSTIGEGTTFIIRLPINLSVSRALMVRVGNDNYAIPMSTIEGVTNITIEQAKEFQQIDTNELEYGGEFYRVKYLGELLGIESSGLHPLNLSNKAPLLLVRSGGERIALRVDELLPSSEIVLKSLGSQFLSVPAISGATILGDGKVIIILDLAALIRNYLVHQSNLQKQADRRDSSHTPIKRMPLVMVVDDSVTVRKVTTRLLERQGMQVITARDGLDAVTLLEEKIPDIMLLDIEMPRMDGFEVASRVRHTEKTKKMPIIMITSRSGEKFKEKAFALCVKEYMSKPFIDANLLQAISNLLPEFDTKSLESHQ